MGIRILDIAFYGSRIKTGGRNLKMKKTAGFFGRNPRLSDSKPFGIRPLEAISVVVFFLDNMGYLGGVFGHQVLSVPVNLLTIGPDSQVAE